MNKEPNSYITIQPNSHYHNAVYNEGLCKSHQYLVIDFFAWVKWYNDARNQRKVIVPPPCFIGETYDAAILACSQLNESMKAEL